MGCKASFRGALYFTKLGVYLACTWPPSKTAPKWKTITYHIAWFILFSSALALFFPLVYSIIKNNTNSLIMTQSACFVGSVSNLIFKMIVYRVHLNRTQSVIYDMEQFVYNAQPHEKIILQNYVNRCSTLHGVISIVNYLTAAIVVTIPFLAPDQNFPTAAAYPFSVNSGILMYLAYFHQSFAGFQCSSGVTIDCQTALMVWFAAARLEILAEEVKYVNDVDGFHSFIRKHRMLLAYASDVCNTMSYVALASSTTCGIAAIMSSVQLFGNQSLAVKMQFAPVAILGTVNYFICAWPADNLINVCELLSNAVYNMSWFDTSMRTSKNVLIVLHRCQTPIIVSIAGFLPTLSLSSYASFLSAIFSYFTTLRLVLMSDADK